MKLNINRNRPVEANNVITVVSTHGALWYMANTTTKMCQCRQIIKSKYIWMLYSIIHTSINPSIRYLVLTLLILFRVTMRDTLWGQIHYTAQHLNQSVARYRDAHKTTVSPICHNCFWTVVGKRSRWRTCKLHTESLELPYLGIKLGTFSFEATVLPTSNHVT